MVIYRVTYPLIIENHHRDFLTKAEAQEFARDMRERQGNMWRHVTITEVTGQ